MTVLSIPASAQNLPFGEAGDRVASAFLDWCQLTEAKGFLSWVHFYDPTFLTPSASL